jgi:kinetochore protein Nuf2
LQCSIDDFAFSDLYRPTYARVTKILSYVINFVRFRESHTAIIDKHFDEAERTKLRVQQLYADKENLEAQLARMQQQRAAVDKANKDKEQQLSELKPKLRQLDTMKDKLQVELKKGEGDLERLRGSYESRATALDELREEATKLKPYTLQKPETLESNLRELNATLATEKSQIELLERRPRALQTSFDAFNTVSTDIQSLTRLLTDLSSDLQKEEDEQSKAARHRDALSERVSSVEDVERQERMMQKQLDGIQTRTEKLRRGAEEKSEGARLKMEELQGSHSTLARERGEKSREVERRRVRIEQVEKKVYSQHEMFIVHANLLLYRWLISKNKLNSKYRLRGRNMSRWNHIFVSTSMRWSKVFRVFRSQKIGNGTGWEFGVHRLVGWLVNWIGLDLVFGNRRKGKIPWR